MFKDKLAKMNNNENASSNNSNRETINSTTKRWKQYDVKKLIIYD